MAGRKMYYYVLVFTANGPVYVTSTNNWERVAHWDKDKQPMMFTRRDDAQFLAKALTINGNSALCVVSEYELCYQPYLYEDGEFEWKSNK